MKRVSPVQEYLHCPPFLVHVALVLICGWIASCWDFNLPFVLTGGFAYLYYVEGRLRDKVERRIRSEERRAKDRKRLLSDAETARWLNTAVEAIWPIFMESFASEKFLMPLAPWFLEKYKPWTAKKVVLEQLCLGRSPPVFTMLRCGRNPTDGDHLVLEMDMKFVSARDMSAVIAVQMKKRVGLGLWTSLNISNVQIEGKLRIGVRFKNGWPVAERLRVCFSEAPILRMTAKPIINYGIDVTDLPGIAGWVDKMIADALEQSLVEPNMLVVDVEKLVGTMMSVNSKLRNLNSEGKEKSWDTDAWFDVENPSTVATVLVEIMDGKKLKPSDPNGKADPYVKVELGAVKKRTSTKHKTLQPAWHQQFILPIRSWDAPNILKLRVRDKDRFGSDDDMGCKEIPCKLYRDGERHEMWVPLEGVKTGEIRIAITIKENEIVPDEKLNCDSLQGEGGSEVLLVSRVGKRNGSFTSASDIKIPESDIEITDSDCDECPEKPQCEVVNVGYGKLGAVSIVTPGNAQVKAANNTERLRQRKKSGAGSVRVDGDGRSMDSIRYEDSLVVADTGRRRAKFKKLLRSHKKSSSGSDASGEMLALAVGEKGTEVHMKVQTDADVVKSVSTGCEIPSSGEFQNGDTDDEGKKGVMKKMGKGLMHKIGRTGKNVSIAIAKLKSPSKKRSLSGKNLVEASLKSEFVETPDAEEKVISSGGLSVDQKITVASGTPSNERRRAETIKDIEISEENDEFEDGTGNSHTAQEELPRTVPSTGFDRRVSSIDFPYPPTGADHYTPNISISPSPTYDSSPPDIPNTSTSKPRALSFPFPASEESTSTEDSALKSRTEDSVPVRATYIPISVNTVVTEDPGTFDAVLLSAGSPVEESYHNLQTFPENQVEEISPTASPFHVTGSSHSEVEEVFHGKQPVEQRGHSFNLQEINATPEPLSEESTHHLPASDIPPVNVTTSFIRDLSSPPSRPPPSIPAATE